MIISDLRVLSSGLEIVPKPLVPIDAMREKVLETTGIWSKSV